MTYDEFQRHVGKAGLTIKGFAEIVKMNRVSLSNYARQGAVPSHLAVIATLMGELADQRVDFRPALERLDLAPKRPRGAGIGRFGGDKQTDLFVGAAGGAASAPRAAPVRKRTRNRGN